MYEDKYIELAKLKKQSRIGVVLIVIESIIFWIVIPIVITFFPELAEKTTDAPLVSILYLFLMVIVIALTFYKFNLPFIKYEGDLEKEVKNNILKKEMNNAFNSSYKEEDEETFETIFNELNIYSSTRHTSDCFSIKYQNTRIKYIDLDITSKDSDGDTTTHFEGHVIELNLNRNIDCILYVSTKVKILFGSFCLLDGFVYKINNKVVVPTNNILKENIVLKSNSNPTIIEDTTFQEIINNIMIDNRYNLIFYKDKLYLFKYDNIDNFEIKVKDKKEELKSEEQIRQEINNIKQELDLILNYKDRLGIKEDTF